MVLADHVSIRYLAGDFSDVGLKEWVIQRVHHERRIEGIWAVNDVSFQLEKGDFMGVIGVNGAGKSTLLKSVTGILPPKKGTIRTDGNVVALLELGTGFDNDLNLRENILMRGALLGYSREFIEERTDEILEFAELTEFQWYKYKQLSSGMRSRLAFSICCLVSPDVLILDEVLSVGDGSFRKKSGDKMLEVIQNGAITLFVGHNTSTMKRLANKLLWLDHGNQIAFAQNREEALELLELYERFLKLRAADPKVRPDLEELRQKKKKPVKKTASAKPATVSAAKHEQAMRNAHNKEVRYRMYLSLLDELVLHPEHVAHMQQYLKEREIRRVAFYGDTAVLDFLIPLLEREQIGVDYIVENTAESRHCDTVIPRGTQEFPETQLIIISDMFFTDRIAGKLPDLTQIPFCSIHALFGIGEDRDEPTQ